MKIKNLIFVILGTLVTVTSCGKVPTSFLPPYSGGLPTREIDGKINLSYSGIRSENLRVIGANETAPNSNGEFTINVFDGFWQPVEVVDSNDNLVGGAYLAPDAESLIINEYSTTLYILFLYPVPWEAITNNSRSDVITQFESHPKFDSLLNAIRNLLRSDPQNLLNPQLHPRIFDLAHDIVKDVLDSYKNKGGAYIDENSCSDPRKITVVNPTNCPYGISSYDLNGNPYDESSYFFDKTPQWVEGKGLLGFLSFLPFISLPEREATFEYGDYVVCLSRVDFMYFATTLGLLGPVGQFVTLSQMWDWDVHNPEGRIHRALNSGDYLTTIRYHAQYRGMVGFDFEILTNIVGIVPGYGDVGEILLSLVEEWINDPHSFDWIGFAIEEGEEFTLDKALEYILKSMSNAILEDRNLRKKLAKKLLGDARYTRKVVERISKFITVIPNVADILITTFDLLTADQTVIYKIHKTPNGGQCVKSAPPEYPYVEITPQNPNVNQTVNITVTSTDPEGKNIKYYFLKNGWNDYDESPYVPSGQSYTFVYTPTTTGRKEFTFYALDVDGAMSGPTRSSIYVLPGANTTFIEDFENYPVGPFSSNAIWQVEYELPSEVRISGIGDTSSRSAKFIDYDPAIGDQYGYYAMIYTETTGNPDIVEFSIRVQENPDAFGVRAWQDFGYWGSMAYYVLTMGGYLRWVRYGYDTTDVNDFVPIMQINPDEWYHIKLVIDWSANSYDIYVNNSLVYSNATFVGYNLTGWPISSAPVFQAVAFTDAQCRGAYLDNVVIHGTSFKSPGKFKNISPELVCRIHNNRRKEK